MRFFAKPISNKFVTDITFIKERLEVMNREISLVYRAMSKTQSENNALADRISKLEDGFSQFQAAQIRANSSQIDINTKLLKHAIKSEDHIKPSTTAITAAPTKRKRNTRATPRKRARRDKH